MEERWKKRIIEAGLIRTYLSIYNIPFLTIERLTVATIS